MSALLHNLMNPLPNAIMTVLMGVMFLYWLVSFIFGGAELDLDVDFDADVDLDIDVAGIDARAIDTSDPSSHIEPSGFVKFLEFVNVGKMPFMVILTVFIFIIWVGSLVVTSTFGMTSLGGLSVLILIPLMVLSIFLTKLATKPLIKVFNAMGYKGEESIDFLGRSGKMTSTIEGDRIGTAEFVIKGDPIRLNVKSVNGDKLTYNEFITVENESPDKKFYYVSKELSLRNLK